MNVKNFNKVLTKDLNISDFKSLKLLLAKSDCQVLFAAK